MAIRELLQYLLLAALALLATPVAATVHCVNTATSIAIAYNLANGSPSGNVEEIRVRAGTYNFSSNLSFGGVGDDKTFELTGGWNSDCTSRVINPANTIFNGAGPGTTQFSFTGNHRHFRVEGIRFQNFGNFFLFENICPFGQSCADTVSVRVRFNHFRLGTSALIIANDAQTYLVSNNLFEGLSGPTGANEEATVRLGYANEDALPQVSYNTFSLNCAVAAKPAIWLHSERDNSLFSHNILVSSGCNSPIFVQSDFNGKAWRFRHDLYPSPNTGLPPAAGSSGNLIGVNPQFVSSSDFHLRESAPVSPAINVGQTPVQAAQDGLSVPAQDLDGPAGGRLVGSNFDMGAFESAVNDATVLLVTNVNDSGTGSLRAAITSANATPGPQKIHFNIPGDCSPPGVVGLQSLLPDITDSVVIDAYSEPDASPNTLSVGSDAVLCVILFGQAANLSHALQVPDSAPADTTLTVKGLAFSSFEGGVAIRLRGGSNHRVQGNAIGGIGPGALGDLFSNTIGVQVRNSAQNALIGGPEPEDRNSIGAATTSAISLLDGSSAGHTIQNNYIGLAASGLAASPIGNGSTGNGIFASASASLHILDNVISAVPDGAAIAITGATASGYEIARNRLGTSASGVPTAAFRNGSGITVSNGSGGHQIGGILNQSVSNTITNSSGAGVHLSASAGVGTTVRPNRIFGNGIDGLGLGIDLDQLGPLANDPGDADGGPNNGQNKPLIANSLPNPDGTRQVSGGLTTQNGSYIIDIYRSPDCPVSGGNMLNLVGTDVVTSLVGSAAIDITIPGGTPGILTAVATRISNGDSSEISDCFLEAHQTTTLITSDTPDPSQFGQNFTVTVQVSSSTGGTPGGTVTISLPGILGSCNALLSNGTGSCQLPSPGIGTVTVTADYPGNFSFLPSSATTNHTIVAAQTSTTIVSDAPDPSEVGQPYLVQMEVRRTHDNALVSGGTVAVSDGSGQTCQTLNVANGVASCQLTSVSTGNKTLTANYAGNTGHATSNDTEPHTVVAAATTTTITSDAPDPSTPGQPYTVMVSVTTNPGAGTPTGSVAVNDGSGASCNITLNTGEGQCQLTSITAGSKTLTASYTSSSQAYANSSDTETHTVAVAATTTTITSDAPDPSNVNQAYTVMVTVTTNPSAGTPTGSVIVSDGTGASCNIILNTGEGQCQLTSTSAGSKTLTASYNSSNPAFANSSDTEPHQVNSASVPATTTDITVHSPNPSRVGQPYTVGITVTSNGGTPAGPFSINGSGGTPSCQGMVVNGSGSCELTSVMAGDSLLTACMPANANFGGSCDSEVHTTEKADTGVDLGAFTPNPVAVGAPLTATATLSIVAPGAGSPTGSLLVSASPTEQCAITLPATQCQLVLSSAGQRNVVVSYPGDANFNPSTRATMVTAVVPTDELFDNGFE